MALPVAWVLAVIINLVPAFMPPSWAMLSVFRIASGAPLLPLTLGGAAASAAGRVGLAWGSARLGNKLPANEKKNAKALGDFIRRHGRWGVVIVFVGCLGPLPSNALFIAAGLGKVALRPLVVAFFLSRVIADTFWVWSAGKVSESTGSLFREQLTSWPAIAIQVAGLLVVVGVMRLPWVKWLGAVPEEAADASATTATTAEPPSETLPEFL